MAGKGKPGRAPEGEKDEQVAELMAEGLLNREIAERMGVTRQCVDRRVRRIIKSMGWVG